MSAAGRDARIPESEAIKVYCPKKKRLVPHWECLGSLVQGAEGCPELIKGTLSFREHKADIRCGPRAGLRGAER